MKISDLGTNYTVTSSKGATIPDVKPQPESTSLQYNVSKPGDRSLGAIAERVGTVAGAVGDVAKGVYDTGKKIAKSVVTAPATIATGVGEATGLLKPGSTYAPEGTYQSDVKQKMEEPGQTPFTAALQTGSEAALDVATAGEGASLLKNKAIPAVTKAVGEKLDTMAANKAAKETGKITDMISPKATAKEAKLAQTQGRFEEGKPGTWLKAGTPDIIKPTQKVLDATETIQKNIPNASKMSEGELYKAVDKNISDTATKLRPQMEATPIKPEAIERLNTDWQALKKAQIAEAPATEEANVAKRQLKFESLLQKSGNQTHADLWDTRIKYDDSIPEGVKKANSMSPESLQIQKDEWLQNRKILNDAIEASSKPGFKQMSDMYEAKNGILSKTKVDKAQISKINQFLKDNPKTAKVLGGVTIYEIAKNLGIPLP